MDGQSTIVIVIIVIMVMIILVAVNTDIVFGFCVSALLPTSESSPWTTQKRSTRSQEKHTLNPLLVKPKNNAARP